MKNVILASTSTVYGSGYLEYLLPELKVFFKDVQTILFIPYARPSGLTYDEYTNIVQQAFNKIDIKVEGIHSFKNEKKAVEDAQAIFTGGGNTFELLTQLYNNDLIEVLKLSIVNGTKYLGTSAGSNICGLTIKTTNDMPVVYPPSFDALGLIPFNINPHYLDSDPKSTHKGETRETRIKEFHIYNKDTVIGLREGSWLEVLGDKITLKGTLSARIFRQNQKPFELETNSEIQSFVNS